MTLNSPSLVVLAFLAILLATIATKTNNDVTQDGDKAKQAKILELLDQYVMHVDKGKSSDSDQVLDLLDQYVMHVDRGANLSLEEFERRKAPASSHVGWSPNMGQQRFARGQGVGGKKRTVGDKIRSIDSVKRHLRGVQRNGETRSRRSVEKTSADESGAERQRRTSYNGRKGGVEGGGMWTHNVKLHPTVTLSWKILNDTNDIEFLVEAATRGYVGVGFSPNGGMAGADIVLGWVDDSNGRTYLVDSHGMDTTGAPIADPEQDCTLLGGKQNDTHTTIQFRRPLDTCDNNHDLKLGGDTVRVIWATHDVDPTLDGGELVGMSWHGKENRGVRSIHLLTPTMKRGVSRGPQTQHWDVTLRDFVVREDMDTLYWCKIFKVPPLNRKHHMIGYEPILQADNEGYVHHMLLYECVAPQTDRIFQKYVTHPGAFCYSPTMPQEWDQCMTAIVAWAIGSQGEFLPEHVGLPLADGDKAKYFMLEIHYDNPVFRKVKDNSGIRIHYTEDLRQYDGGVLVNGITITPLHIVPPHQPEYRTAGYCSSDCTNKMLPQTGIKLISVVLHSHLAGKKLRLRHIRNGRELPRVAEDDHYDFNYQQARVLPQEVSVLPGDELVTECVYQTPNRTQPTFGGYSTKQEMCLAFVLYYPRTPLAACYSMTPVKYFFETFGVRQFYDVDMDTVERMFLKLPLSDAQGSNQVSRTTTTTTTSTTPSFPTGPGGALDEEANERAISVLKQMKDFTVEAGDGAGGAGGLFGELIIREPDEFRNRNFTSHLVELPWTEKLLTQRVEESFYAGKHMVFCRLHDDQLAIPLAITTFPNFTELKEQTTSNNSRCEGKIQHSKKLGNTAATIKMNGIVALIASICIYRLQQ